MDCFQHKLSVSDGCFGIFQVVFLGSAVFYDKKKKTINTAIIYGCGIESVPDKLNHGSLHYDVTNVYMCEYNGDKIYEELMEKVQNHDQLSETDQLNLIFLPLMSSSVDKSRRAIEAIEVA